MPGLRIGRTCPREDGFALIEVVVSALIAAIVVGGVISLLSATGKAATEQRRRSQAYAVAQEDQTRLRGTQLAALNNEIEPRTLTMNGITYTVESTARFIADSTGTTTCTGGEASADYVRIGSTVRWSTMRPGALPVVLESIVSPVSGSLDPTSGSVSVHAFNGAVPSAPISGVGITGTGAGTFSGSTDSNGCAVFGGLVSGKYTLTPSLSSEYVDVNGEAPKAQTVTVSSGSISPVELLYDRQGTVNVAFKVRNSAGTVVRAVDDGIIATATGLTSGARRFGTQKSYVTSIAATPLFPFNYTYGFFAGACGAPTPAPEAAAILNLKAPRGTSASGEVQLPALYVTVKNGSENLTGAKVTVTDNNCSANVFPTYTTTAGTIEKTTGGYLENVGFPTGTYTVCASATIGTQIRRIKMTKEVKAVTGTTAAFNLGAAGYETGSAC